MTRARSPLSLIGAACGLTLLFVSSCVRIAPPPLEAPPVAFHGVTLCARVDQTEGWAEPGDEKARFHKGADPRVCALLRFGALSGAHTLAWKWYGPSRALVRTTDPIVLGEDGKSFDRYIAWDVLSVSDGTQEGPWTVAVFLDGLLVGTRGFEVAGRKEPGPRPVRFSRASGSGASGRAGSDSCS